MTYLQPFILLMGRAAVFWVGATALLVVTIIVVGTGQPDAVTAPYLDPVFLAVFGFPAAAGWLAGAIIQEFLHSSFAWALPSVLRRLAAGFVAGGLVVSLSVAALAFQSQASTLSFAVLLAVGLGGYGFCSSTFGSRGSRLVTCELVIIGLVIVRSRYLSELANRNPLLISALFLGLGSLGLFRLLSRSGLRRRAFRLATPFPGTHSLERSIAYDRQKTSRGGAQKDTWTTGYLGTRSWNWVRATIRTNNPHGWKAIPRFFRGFWTLGLLFVIHAWSDKGDLSFWEALGRTTHGALLSSPYVIPFSEHSDHNPIVILVIAAMGVVLALWSTPDLGSSVAYPLSRRQLAATTYGVALCRTVMFCGGILLILSLAGQLAGWLSGIPPRFDFLPYFVHPLMATAILMPLANWGSLHLQVATARKTPNTLVAVVFGVLGFVGVVWAWTAFSPRLFTSPVAEMAFSVVLFLVSQEIFRRKLVGHFSTADLV